MRRTVMLAAAALAAAACTTTTYRGYDGEPAGALPWDREIVYEVDPAIYAASLACVVVAPAPHGEDSPLAEIIERALARHLSERFGRVIGPAERRRIERELAFDLSAVGDRRHFAQGSGCRVFLDWTVLAATEDYAVVFSQRRFGMEITLSQPGAGAPLWQAAHLTRRAEGGLPLSLVSVPLAAFEATRFHRDHDIVASMVEDVVRRLFVTLPDLG